jgi:hypothetical protein
VSVWLKLSLVTCLAVTGSLAAGYKSLFDGKTLKGWKTDGKAEWTVEQGAIVGRQGPGTAGGDLYTNEQWVNFDLQLQFNVHWPANSGIWFRRSPSQPGYQADILDQPNYPDTFSGSLVAMGTGFLAKNADSRSVKKQGWNGLRIRVTGDSIVIFVNGKQVVSTRDSKFLKPGSIGIEVHPGSPFQGMEIRVRHVRLKRL